MATAVLKVRARPAIVQCSRHRAARLNHLAVYHYFAEAATAVRVHQTSDHVDAVQFRFDGDVFHGTFGGSGKPTAVVTLDLDDDEDITSIKLTFANEMMWAKSLAFTTSKGRVVDSGGVIQQLSAGGFVSRYNQPSVTMANNGAPLTGFVDELCLEEDPEMGTCLTQKITFKF